MSRLASATRWLERSLKTDVRYTLSGGFYLAVAQVVSAVAALGLTIAFANLLPVETYGTYRYVLAVYGLFTLAALPGMESSVLQSVSRGFDNSFWTGLRAKRRWGILGAFASFIYAAYLFSQGSLVMGSTFMVAGAVIPLMESYALYASFLNAKKLFRAWAAIDIVMQIASVLCLVATMLLTKNIVVLLSAYFLPYITFRMAASYAIWRRYAREDDAKVDPDLLSYGRSMTLFQVIGKLMASADQVVLYHFLGPAQVAIFSLATAVPNRIMSMLRISGNLASPKFANRTGAEIAGSLPRKMVLFAASIVAVCIVYVVAAPNVFTYIFPRYLPALQYSQVVVFFTISAITYPFSSYLLTHKKLRENYVISIATFVAKISCLVLLVPRIGVWGAVVGLLATSAMNMVMAVWYIFRDRNVAQVRS